MWRNQQTSTCSTPPSSAVCWRPATAQIFPQTSICFQMGKRGNTAFDVCGRQRRQGLEQGSNISIRAGNFSQQISFQKKKKPSVSTGPSLALLLRPSFAADLYRTMTIVFIMGYFSRVCTGSGTFIYSFPWNLSPSNAAQPCFAGDRAPDFHGPSLGTVREGGGED